MAEDLDRLLRRIARLPPEAVKAAREALLKQAGQLTDLMRSAVARGEQGALYASIRIESGSHELQLLVKAGGPTTTRGGYDYANAVEFGTEKVAAQPFFFPSYRFRRKAIRSAVRRAVVKAMKNG